MTAPPFDFREAREASEEAARAQEEAENNLAEAYTNYATAEKNYRMELAKAIVRLHDDEGKAWSVCADLARGDPRVGALRHIRDVAEGLREAQKQAGWRLSANRRDTAALIDWSARRELAENPPVRSYA